jgi:hypothetical protein
MVTLVMRTHGRGPASVAEHEQRRGDAGEQVSGHRAYVPFGAASTGAIENTAALCPDGSGVGFRDRPIQPLSHLSKALFTRLREATSTGCDPRCDPSSHLSRLIQDVRLAEPTVPLGRHD